MVDLNPTTSIALNVNGLNIQLKADGQIKKQDPIICSLQVFYLLIHYHRDKL